ncbi:hypothetical protein SAMN05216490_1885 [Mucilaginibacter mallensis]|uniref:Uncharacterized protein n=1 Tax=Mucilaginibacter mallensis TaxID=652787 RepID=A0A1H1VBY8_MUCMA|nr:hypothetical protein [Mucilaginibacter mallensis]SDS82278.1 hypothetical protein SAMN05216490_1885 [Mucilaginibacter mallensis]
MPYKKGEGGRRQGAVNQTTKLVREVFNDVFHKLQSHPTANLYNWAIQEPGDFYKLASKLIPGQVNLDLDVHSFKLLNVDPLNNTDIEIGDEVDS